MGSFRLRILWVFLLLLAAFVIFVEFIAETGSRADPIPKPPPQSSTPAARNPEQADPQVAGLAQSAHSVDSNSKTN